MPSCRADFRSIRSYAAANDFLANAKPYPETNTSDPHSKYRLEATRKRHMNIRLMGKWDFERVYIETFGAAQDHWGQRHDHSELSQLNLRAATDLRHIALQLYSTDVVVWREDETIFFDPYVSNSTNAFVSKCTPSGLDTHYEPRASLIGCGPGYFRDAAKRIYRAERGRRVAFQRDPARGNEWYPVPGSGIEPWIDLTVPRKAANAVLKAANFRDFSLWVTGFCAMTEQPYGSRDAFILTQHKKDLSEPEDEQVVAMLADKEKWQKLARMPWFWPELSQPTMYGPGRQWAQQRLERIKNNPSYVSTLHAEKLIERVRLALYRASNVIEEVNKDFLVGYNNVTSYFRAWERYFNEH